jgi:hypothetical protein
MFKDLPNGITHFCPHTTNHTICDECLGKTVSYTATVSTSKFDDWIIDDFVEFVFKAKLESDAVKNTKRILEQYEKRLTAWQLIKLLLNK